MKYEDGDDKNDAREINANKEAENEKEKKR